MKTVPAKELKNKIGSVMSLAAQEPIGITKNGHFSYVLLSANDWENIGGEAIYAQRNAMKLIQNFGLGMPKKSWKDTQLFGMWADRKDMDDPSEYVRELRKPRF